ncbi:MAG: hypothetical protein ABI547_02235 [Betaproteobacteria bacterium]
MRNANAFVAASILVITAGLTAAPAGAADLSDQSKSAPPPKSAKPMAMKEPMAGEMKKDGMLKEDVSKAGAKWRREMDEKMKQEQMK